MKKIELATGRKAALALALAAAFVLAGCSGEKTGGTPAASGAASQPAQAEQLPAVSSEAAASSVIEQTVPEVDSVVPIDGLQQEWPALRFAPTENEALMHAWDTWEDWDKVDPDVLDAWLDTLETDHSTDPAYPGLTMDILQGSWHSDGELPDKSGQVDITISDNLCTLTCPLLGYDHYTVPCMLVNRSYENNCPMLVALVYPQLSVVDGEQQGFPLYINAMTRYDHFDTTDWGSFDK